MMYRDDRPFLDAHQWEIWEPAKPSSSFAFSCESAARAALALKLKCGSVPAGTVAQHRFTGQKIEMGGWV